MKEYRIELNNLTVKIIRNENHSVIKKISTEDLNSLSAGNIAVIIQDAFFCDDFPSISLLYELAKMIQDIYPDNKIDWIKTFKPIEEWAMDDPLFSKEAMNTQEYDPNDYEPIENDLKHMIRWKLMEYDVL